MNIQRSCALCDNTEKGFFCSECLKDTSNISDKIECQKRHNKHRCVSCEEKTSNDKFCSKCAEAKRQHMEHKEFLKRLELHKMLSVMKPFEVTCKSCSCKCSVSQTILFSVTSDDWEDYYICEDCNCDVDYFAAPDI